MRACANALASLEADGAVDPSDALVIVRHAITPQQYDHSWQAIAAMFRCQCNETQPQRLIVPPRLVVEKLAIDADPAADRSFLRSEPFSYGLHRGFALYRPQTFPSATTFSASMLSA